MHHTPPKNLLQNKLGFDAYLVVFLCKNAADHDEAGGVCAHPGVCVIFAWVTRPNH